MERRHTLTRRAASAERSAYDRAVSGLRYRLFGGLEVLDGSLRLDLGARKRQAVLAALLSFLNQEARCMTWNNDTARERGT